MEIIEKEKSNFGCHGYWDIGICDGNVGLF